jgi:GntR family transcriptional regulator of vanillate catabolism
LATQRSRQQFTAVRRLRELIVAGRFTPGQRISELAAVEELGISRTPVRLALQALAHEGLLESRATGGFVVRDFSLEDILDAIDLRGVLEGMAARLAAERSSGEQNTKTLRSIVARIDTLLDRADLESDELFESYSELNLEFHAEMLRLAKCPMLERSLAQVIALPFASPNAFVKASLQQEQSRRVLVVGQSQHRALVNAIAAGESARAVRVGQEHAQTAADGLKQLVQQDELQGLLPVANLLRRSRAAGGD